MDNPLSLVEVDGFGNIIRDDGIVLPEFGNAIYLNGKLNGDALALQVTSERYCGSGSPALAEENDAGTIFFLRGKNTVVIGIKQANDGFFRQFSAAVLENLNVSSRGSSAADMLSNFDWTVVRIVMPYETTNESDDDVLRRV